MGKVGVFFLGIAIGISQNFFKLNKNTKKQSKFSIKSLEKVLVDTKRDSTANYVHN